MKYLDNFKNFNRVKKCNYGLQVALIVILLVGLQLMLNNCSVRFDFSETKCNSLSPETKTFLCGLKNNVDIILLDDGVHMNEGFLRQMHRLVSLYQEVAKHVPTVAFNFKHVDTLKNPQATLQIKTQYDLSVDEGVIVNVDKKLKVLHMENFYQSDERQKVQFVGEHVLTNTLIDLAQNKSKVIYWTIGRREYNFTDVNVYNGASLAAQTLRQCNFELRELDHFTKVPQDASMLVIAGPQIPFLTEECDALKDYLLQRQGRILLCLQPIYDHGLDPLLKQLGVEAEDQLLLDNGKDFLSAQGSLIIRRLNRHAITQTLIENSLGLTFGLVRPIRIDPTHLAHCTPLLYSAETSWSKKRVDTEHLFFDPQSDMKGPHVLACVFDNMPSINLDLSLSSSKAIIVGCADWLSNGKFLSLGNRCFCLNCLKWAFGDDYTFLIRPLPLMQYPLMLSQQKILMLLINFLILPFVFCLFGIITLSVRKQ